MSSVFISASNVSSSYTKAGEELPKAVIDLPEELDQEIARIKLETMGLSIDSLTDEQVAYATDYSAGT